MFAASATTKCKIELQSKQCKDLQFKSLHAEQKRWHDVKYAALHVILQHFFSFTIFTFLSFTHNFLPCPFPKKKGSAPLSMTAPQML
jgi:hypothetical protein